MTRRPHREAFLLAVFSLSTAPSHAQQAVVQAPDPGQLLRQEQPFRLPDLPSTELPATLPRPIREVVPVTPGGVAIDVRGFRFEGLTVMTSDEAQALVASSVGQSLTFSQLLDLASLITSELTHRGYFLAQVILPPQDVAEGIVNFKVIEGALSTGDSAIHVDSERPKSSQFIGGVLSEAVGPGPVQEQRLERGILILNDLPGVNATVTLQPGQQSETASLDVALKSTPLVRGSASMDTFGNRYTGSIRAGVSLFLDNLTGRADQVSATAVKALDGNSEFTRLSYLTPVGYSSLQVGVNTSYLTYGVGRDLASLNTKGTASTRGLVARYSWVRSRLKNLYLNATLEDKTLRSGVPAGALTDKRVTFSTVGLNGDLIDQFLGGGITATSIVVGQGRLDLDALSVVKTADASDNGFKTQGTYQRVNYSLNRFQTLQTNTMLQLSVSGQYADRNLDSSEKMSLGGPLAVRAYPAGEALGDRGFVATAEIRTVIAKSVRFEGFTVGDIQVAAFYDQGRIQQYTTANAALTTPNQYGLAGAGFGLNMGQAGVYDFRLLAARKVGSNPGLSASGRDSDGDHNRGRIAAQLNIYF